MTEYLIAILSFAAIYGLVALGLNIQWGMTGLINLGQVAFVAVGAYATAIAGPVLGIGPGLILGMIVGGILGALVALLSPRLREDYLAIVTLGFSEFVRLIFLNEKWLAGGPDGVGGISRPLGALTGVGFFTVCLCVLVVAIAFSLRVEYSPLGRLLRSIREDELVAEVVGKPTLRYKVLAFSMGAVFAALGGGLFASFLTYVSPDMFGPNVSVIVLAAVLISRQGSTFGAIAGIVVVTGLVEGTRLLQDHVTVVDGVQLAALRLIALGAGLIGAVFIKYRFGNRGA